MPQLNIELVSDGDEYHSVGRNEGFRTVNIYDELPIVESCSKQLLKRPFDTIRTTSTLFAESEDSHGSSYKAGPVSIKGAKFKRRVQWHNTGASSYLAHVVDFSQQEKRLRAGESLGRSVRSMLSIGNKLAGSQGRSASKLSKTYSSRSMKGPHGSPN